MEWGGGVGAKTFASQRCGRRPHVREEGTMEPTEGCDSYTLIRAPLHMNDASTSPATYFTMNVQ